MGISNKGGLRQAEYREAQTLINQGLADVAEDIAEQNAAMVEAASVSSSVAKVDATNWQNFIASQPTETDVLMAFDEDYQTIGLSRSRDELNFDGEPMVIGFDETYDRLSSPEGVVQIADDLEAQPDDAMGDAADLFIQQAVANKMATFSNLANLDPKYKDVIVAITSEQQST